MITAAIFPGQGAEYPGMLDCIRGRREAARIFGRIEEVSGRQMPETAVGDWLDDHLNAQLAVFGTSVCYWELLRGTVRFDRMAGHSLGFYAALCASGALALDDCVRVIMEVQTAIEAGSNGTPGGMASVLGLPEPRLEAICSRVGGVYVANVNSATQIVISGTKQSVSAASRLALEAGALAVKELPIRHPLHSPLMQGIEERLTPFVRTLAVSRPHVPLLSHLDASLLDVDGIRTTLAGQLVRKVAWRQTVTSLAAAGTGRFFELGPSDTLSKLVRWIERGAESVQAEEVLRCRAA
ncbi:MAG: ACP S-malonyltransferase [Thermodesulfovibrionales bacterium]